MDISGGHCKIGLYYGIISIFLGYLFKVKVQNGNIFGGRSILNSFGVCLILPIFFGENNRCWVQAYVFRKVERTLHGVASLLVCLSSILLFTGKNSK